MTAERAVSYAEEAVEHYPHNLELRRTLAHVLDATGRSGDAVVHLEAALLLVPPMDAETTAEITVDLGAALIGAGDATRGGACYIEAAEAFGRLESVSRPSIHRLMASLSTGDYTRGFPALAQELEARHGELVAAGLRPRHRAKAGRAWQGERAPGGVLVDATEWGYGDVIMGARWLPAALERAGGPVVLLLQQRCASLAPFLKGQGTGVRVVTSPDAVLPTVRWTRDYRLPTLLAVQKPRDVAGEPYFRSLETFRPLDGEFRVGIRWAGLRDDTRDRLRSSTLAAWAPVIAISGRHVL
jgi:hypothetical protein